MERILDWLAELGHRLLVGISLVLSPLAAWIDEIGFATRELMDRMGVPLGAQGWIIAAGWAVLVLGLLWVLRGWWRIGAAVVVAVVLVRYFHVLPGV